jgi:hypothetical protein
VLCVKRWGVLFLPFNEIPVWQKNISDCKIIIKSLRLNESRVPSHVIALGSGSMLVVWHGFCAVLYLAIWAGPKHGKNGPARPRFGTKAIGQCWLEARTGS